MKSSVIKRSIVLAGHKTSVSLEDAFWRALKEIAGGRQITLSDLVSSIDSERQQGNLSSAVRLFVLDFHRRRLADLKEGQATRLGDLEEGHGRQMAELSVPLYSRLA
jgi:predicted DNA-binding ribbon-helix-helix protein